MKYNEFAKIKFDQIVTYAEPADCSVAGSVVDAGVSAPGGWSSAKSLIEGLTGGRGQVGFASRLIDGFRLPTIDMFLDDPVGAWEFGYAPRDGGCGVLDDDGSFALGLCLCDDVIDAPKGNVVVARENSLLGVIFYASSALPKAIRALLEAGIAKDDIKWGWSSSPIAAFTDDKAETSARMGRLMKDEATISVWLRANDDKLKTIVASSGLSGLRLHNLVSGNTITAK